LKYLLSGTLPAIGDCSVYPSRSDRRRDTRTMCTVDLPITVDYR